VQHVTPARLVPLQRKHVFPSGKAPVAGGIKRREQSEVENIGRHDKKGCGGFKKHNETTTTTKTVRRTIDVGHATTTPSTQWFWFLLAQKTNDVALFGS
jgi:hypothetical protein